MGPETEAEGRDPLSSSHFGSLASKENGRRTLDKELVDSWSSGRWSDFDPGNCQAGLRWRCSIEVHLLTGIQKSGEVSFVKCW